jgi:serine/threonine protein kinase
LIVLERIDGGSFGDVFRAWDPALAKVVALKRSRYSSATDAARAVREGQRLARIPPHPNVITVYGACEINGVVGIWMEFLSGRTLQRVVKDEVKISCAEATHYGASLCRALSHIHGAGVLHRDLKAANVMKAAGGRIVLLDFGSGVANPRHGRATSTASACCCSISSLAPIPCVAIRAKRFRRHTRVAVGGSCWTPEPIWRCLSSVW